MPLLMCGDLDDTLVERAPVFRTWAEGFLAAQVPDQAAPELVEWLVQEERGGHRPRDEFIAAVVERLGSRVPRDELVADTTGC
jgi:hypothetical protein